MLTVSKWKHCLFQRRGKTTLLKNYKIEDHSNNFQQDVKGDYNLIKEEFHSHQLSIIEFDFWMLAAIPPDQENSFLWACGDGSESKALGMQA